MLRKRRWRPLLLVAGTLLLLGAAAWAVRASAQARAQAAWATAVAAALPPDATLLAFGLTDTLRQVTSVETIELFDLTERDLSRQFAAAADLYLLLDPENVASQWAGQSPDRSFRWFQEHTALVRLGRFGPYELFRVRPKSDFTPNEGAPIFIAPGK